MKSAFTETKIRERDKNNFCDGGKAGGAHCFWFLINIKGTEALFLQIITSVIKWVFFIHQF